MRTRSLDRTCRGCHLLCSGLVAFNDGITKFVVEHRDPPLPQGSRLGDFAQPGKSARLRVPRVAFREDVRESGTILCDSGAALSVLSRQNL